jgi:hypothetical protein
MHPPTNLYMLYPMVQSFALVCVENIQENDAAKALSITIIHFTVGAAQQHPSVPTRGLTGTVQAHRVNINIHS